MLRTIASQYGARRAEGTSARRFDPAVSAIIDRNVRTLRDTEPLSAAVERLLGGESLGIPIVDSSNAYRGTCTLRSVASLGLLINGETAALISSLGFLNDDLARIRQRLGASLAMPVVQAVDPFVPVIEPGTTLPEIFFQFYRGHAMIPVVEAETRRLVGIIGCERT